MEAILLDIWNYICKMELKDFIALGALLVSLQSLYWSNKARERSNDLTRLINSKKYQLNENTIEMAVQIISAVRAVDGKAAVAIENEQFSHKANYKIDYSSEINLLSKIFFSPEFPLFLKAIKGDKERCEMECYLHKLALRISSIIEYDDLEKIRIWSDHILKQLKYYKDKDDIKDSTISDYITDLSEMKRILTEKDT